MHNFRYLLDKISCKMYNILWGFKFLFLVSKRGKTDKIKKGCTLHVQSFYLLLYKYYTLFMNNSGYVLDKLR